jgi:hypothetical protein
LNLKVVVLGIEVPIWTIQGVWSKVVLVKGIKRVLG